MGIRTPDKLRSLYTLSKRAPSTTRTPLRVWLFYHRKRPTVVAGQRSEVRLPAKLLGDGFNYSVGRELKFVQFAQLTNDGAKLICAILRNLSLLSIQICLATLLSSHCCQLVRNVQRHLWEFLLQKLRSFCDLLSNVF